MRYLSVLLSLAFALLGQAQTVGNFVRINGTGGTQLVTPFTGNSTAGDCIALGILRQTAGVTITSVQDDDLNSYTFATTQVILPTFANWADQIWYTCNISVSLHLRPSITINMSSNVGYTLRAAEITCTPSPCTFDKSNQATIANSGTAGTQNSSGNITTTKANEILVGIGLTNNGTIHVGTGFTSSPGTACFGGLFDCIEFQNQTSIGTYSANFSSTANSDEMTSSVASFTSAAATSTGYPMVIKYRSTPKFSIPFDDRKKSLEIVRI